MKFDNNFYKLKRNLGKLNFWESKFHELDLKLNFRKLLQKWYFV